MCIRDRPLTMWLLCPWAGAAAENAVIIKRNCWPAEWQGRCTFPMRICWRRATDKIRKYVLPNIPYLFIGWFCLKIGTAYRLAAGTGFGEKLLGLGLSLIHI